MKTNSRLTTLRLILGGLLVLLIQTTLALFKQIQALGVLFFPTSQMWLLFIVLSLACLLVFDILVLTWTKHRHKMLSSASSVIQSLPSSKPVVLILLFLITFGFAIVSLLSWGAIFGADAFHWLAVGVVLILVLMLMRRLWPDSNWLNLLAVTGLVVAFVYRLCQFFPDISVYPFSLGWSEASRFYYASLFFSEKIYDLAISPSTLHPTRYLMQSLPFMIDGLPLWFHRLWQVLLWLVCLAGTGVLLSHRIKIPSKTRRLIFVVWVFLYLWQGPVYYHLLIIVMIVLWGFNYQKPWRTLIVVVIASIWAGISRVNWFPVPGMLAATLYFLERPIILETNGGSQSDASSNNLPIRSVVESLFKPVLWVVVGTLIALGSQSLYILWSGNDPGQFASSFFSDLLWYRLLPNSTYSLGILTGIVVLSLPILILIYYRYRTGGVGLHPIGLLGLGTILGVLLVGGIIVSVKIGGGSNLHNLDAYLMMLMVIGSYFYFWRVPIGFDREAPTRQIPASLNLFLVVIPVLFSLKSTDSFVQYQPQTAEDSIFKLQRNINRALEDGGEVLFISERQLLSFDYISGATLVPEYEKVFLMEMVMAGNQDYLSVFEEEIRSQRFDLIITDPLFDQYKESGESWAEENNVWVDSVSVPVLCHYWRKVTFPESGVQILSPRKNPVDCSSILDINQEE